MIEDSQIYPDSTAFALNIKNFGYLPREMQQSWSMDFLSARRGEVTLPKRLIVELLNSCNYDCPMCRVGRYGVNLSRKLPKEDFIGLLDDLEGPLEEVRLNGLGESTLLPDFPEYVNEIVCRGLKVELISNGSGRVSDYDLLLKNNGIVIISWDAAKKKTFEILRRPAIWENSVAKLVDIAKAARLQGKSDRLFLMFTLQRINVDELPELIRLCDEWDVRNVMVNVVKLPGNSLNEAIDNIREKFLEAEEAAVEHSVSLMLPDQICGKRLHVKNALETSSHGCMMPWEEAVIRWNGDVQACNMFNPYIYGNIRLRPFREIWNNPFASVFRKNLNGPLKHPYCVDCVYMRDAYAKRSV